MKVCVERANGLDNASNASGPTPSREPRYGRFKEMAEILRELQVADALELGAAVAVGGEDDAVKASGDLVLRLKPQAELQPRISRLQELRGVKFVDNELRLTNNFLNHLYYQLIHYYLSILLQQRQYPTRNH